MMLGTVDKFANNPNKKDKLDTDDKEDQIKYDIYEERDIVTASDGASTARKALPQPQMESEGGTEERLESKNFKTFNGMETQNNSLNDDNPEKNITAKKLMGYYKSKNHPEPDAYDDYCIAEDEFFPSILNE